MKEDRDEYENMCFVIMPIGELESYPPDHFQQVYEDILKPAITQAGYIPKRADDDRASNMIQVRIIEDVVNAPMAVCDLSTRTPNVLFELGIRQAFDLPVVLVQEKGTPRIFDISTINTIDYGKELRYREVLKDVETICEAIKATKDSSKGINSVIKLLSVRKAELNNNEQLSDADELQMLLYSNINKMEKLQKDLEQMQKLMFSPYYFKALNSLVTAGGNSILTSVFDEILKLSVKKKLECHESESDSNDGKET